MRSLAAARTAAARRIGRAPATPAGRQQDSRAPARARAPSAGGRPRCALLCRKAVRRAPRRPPARAPAGRRYGACVCTAGTGWPCTAAAQCQHVLPKHACLPAPAGRGGRQERRAARRARRQKGGEAGGDGASRAPQALVVAHTHPKARRAGKRGTRGPTQVLPRRREEAARCCAAGRRPSGRCAARRELTKGWCKSWRGS